MSNWQPDYLERIEEARDLTAGLEYEAWAERMGAREEEDEEPDSEFAESDSERLDDGRAERA